ncbi:hypothetical protein DFJ74DRAFT_472129 [Hyaloraphidium curvatum]|nr:hypothetical protein DFJ74DRAFT_472129 [Hyaloraphidium curvatum]
MNLRRGGARMGVHGARSRTASPDTMAAVEEHGERYVPPELATIISLHVHPNDLFALALTARSFAVSAIPRLWATRTLNLSALGDEEEGDVFFDDDNHDLAAYMSDWFYTRGLRSDRRDTVSVLRTNRMPPSIASILKLKVQRSSRTSDSSASLEFDYPSLLRKLAVRRRKLGEVLPLLRAVGKQLQVLDMRGVVYDSRDTLVVGHPESPFSHLSRNLEYLDVSRAWVLRSAKRSGAATKGVTKSKRQKGEELAQSLRRAGWVDLYAACLKSLGNLPMLSDAEDAERRGLLVLCIGNTLDDTSKLRVVLESLGSTLEGLVVDALALNASMGLAGARLSGSAGLEACSKLQWIVIENQLDPNQNILGSLFRTSPIPKGEQPLRTLAFRNTNLTTLRWLSNYPYQIRPDSVEMVHLVGDFARLGSEPTLDGSLLSAFPQIRHFGVECPSRAALHSAEFRASLRESIGECLQLETFSLTGVGTNRALPDEDVAQLLSAIVSPNLKTIILPFADRFHVANRLEFGTLCCELAAARWADTLEKVAFGPEIVMSAHDLAAFVTRFGKLRDVEVTGLAEQEFNTLKNVFSDHVDYWAWQVQFERSYAPTSARWSSDSRPTLVRLATRAAVRAIEGLLK